MFSSTIASTRTAGRVCSKLIGPRRRTCMRWRSTLSPGQSRPRVATRPRRTCCGEVSRAPSCGRRGDSVHSLSDSHTGKLSMRCFRCRHTVSPAMVLDQIAGGTHSREKPSDLRRVQEARRRLWFRCQAGPNYSTPSSRLAGRSILRRCALRPSLRI